jgi:hypothetical protein
MVNDLKGVAGQGILHVVVDAAHDHPGAAARTGKRDRIEIRAAGASP